MSAEELARAYTDLGIAGLDALAVEGLGMTHDQLTEELATRTTAIDARVAVEPKEYGDDLIDPPLKAASDLDSVDGYALPPNAQTPATSREWQIKLPENPEDESAEQILPLARVNLKNGQLAVTDLRPPLQRLNDNPYIDNSYSALVDNVVRPDAPVMKQVLGAGHVKEYLYGYSTLFTTPEFSPSPLAHPSTRQVVNFLPTGRTQTYQEVRETDRHETAHQVLYTSAASASNTMLDTSPEMQEMRAACKQLRDLVLSEADLWPSEDELLRLRKLERGREKDLDLLLGAFRGNSSFDRMQPDARDIAGDFDAPECTIDRPTRMMGNLVVRRAKSVKHENNSKEISRLWGAVNEEFGIAIRSTAIERTIAEHGYEDNELAGHPESGFDELGASLYGIATTYPDEFMSNLSYIDWDSARVIIRTYRATKAVIRRADPAFAAGMPEFDFRTWDNLP
jgi:hypothetical protein